MKKLFSIIVLVACAFGFSLNVQAENLCEQIQLGPELNGGTSISKCDYDGANNINSVTVTLTMNEQLLESGLNQRPGIGSLLGTFYVGMTPTKYNSAEYVNADGGYTFKKENLFALHGSDAAANKEAVLQKARNQAYFDTSIPTWINVGQVQYNNGSWTANSTATGNKVKSNKEFLSETLGVSQLTYGENYRLGMWTAYDWYFTYYVDDENYDVIKVSFDVKYPIVGNNNTIAYYYPTLEMALANSNKIDINANTTVDSELVINEGTTVNINNGAILLINTDVVTNNGSVKINSGSITGTKVKTSKFDSIIIPDDYESTNTSTSVLAVKNVLADIEKKKDSSIIFQKEFNELVDELQTSIDALIPLADYSVLKEKVAEANEKIATGYYEDTTQLSTILKNINKDLDHTQQDIVDDYVQAIKAAIGELVLKDADYTEVDKAISSAENVNRDLYTDESLSDLDNAVDNVVDGIKIDRQSEVDQFAKDINTAIKNLVYKPADYAKVDEAKSKIPSDLTIYTNVSRNSLENVLSEIDYGLNILEQETVNEYASKILDAIKKLEVLADYTLVDEALDSIPSDMTIYTDDSIAKFDEIMNSINIDRDLSLDEQDIVIGYANAINDAVLSLVEKAGDYSVVEAAIANIPADLSIYTKDSVTILINALNDIEYGLKISKQAIIIGYADAINDAVDNLVYKAIIDAEEVDTKTEVNKVTIGVTDINTTEKILRDSLNNSKFNDIENCSVAVDITMDDKFKVDQTIANMMSSALTKNINNAVIANYFDISINIYDNFTGSKLGNLTTLNNPLGFTIALPKELKTVRSGYTRKFYILRYHEGSISIIATYLTSDGQGLTFKSDKFSTYALAYVDVENTSSAPSSSNGSNGSSNVTPPYTNDNLISNVVLCGVSILAIIGSAIIYKRKRDV